MGYCQLGLRGLYQGLSPNLVGNTPAWGLYFHMNSPALLQLPGQMGSWLCSLNTLKGLLRESESSLLPPQLNLGIGLVAGPLHRSTPSPLPYSPCSLSLVEASER